MEGIVKTELYRLILPLLLSSAVAAPAATITAASGNPIDVQTAIKSAADGDTVIIPNGHYTWHRGVVIAGKTIHLLGQSKGGVVITNHLTGGFAVDVTKSSTGYQEVADLKFIGTTVTNSWGSAHVSVGGATGGLPVLIHDNTFLSAPDGGYMSYCITMYDNGSVIWNCDFQANGNDITGIQFYSQPSDWTYPETLGMDDSGGTHNTYVEDCTFEGGYIACSNFDDNSRVCWRHNTMTNSTVTNHGCESSPYGCRQWDIYNNVFVYDGNDPSSSGLQDWFLMRGGTGTIHDNAMPGIPWKGAIGLAVYSLCKPSQIPPPAVNASRSAYPACRQIGQGWGGGAASHGYTYIDQNGGTYPPNNPDAAIIRWGNSVGMGYQANSALSNAGYILDPIRIWNNRAADGSILSDTNYPGYAYGYVGPDDYAGSSDALPTGQVESTYVQENRDYYVNVARPNYAPYTYPHPLRSRAVASSPATK
jgi:hypothetical protein